MAEDWGRLAPRTPPRGSLAVVVFATTAREVLVVRSAPASSFPGPKPTPELRRPASRASFFMTTIVRRISDSAFEHWSRCFRHRCSAAQDIAEDALLRLAVALCVQDIHEPH